MIYRAAWKKGDIIRKVLTGKPYLVLHLFTLGNVNTTASLVVPLEERLDPVPTSTILQRDYDNYVKDCDFDVRTNSVLPNLYD